MEAHCHDFIVRWKEYFRSKEVGDPAVGIGLLLAEELSSLNDTMFAIHSELKQLNKVIIMKQMVKED